MNESSKKTADEEKQGDAVPGRVPVRSKSCPHRDKRSLRFGLDEDHEPRMRPPWDPADDFALPLGEAFPFEFSEGKWLRSELHTSELSPPSLDNATGSALIERLIPMEHTSRSSPSIGTPSGGEASPSSTDESQSIITITEGTTDTFLRMPLEFVPLLCAGKVTADGSESSILPVVRIAPVGVRSSGTFSVQEMKERDEREPPLGRRPVVMIFDDSTERSGGSPPVYGEEIAAYELVEEAVPLIPEQDTLGGTLKGDTTEMQYNTLREKVLTESLIDQPGSRAMPTPGFLSPREPSVQVLRCLKTAASQTEKGPVLVYTNCPDSEHHNTVARKLRTIPMRLFMANLFLAFFFLVLMHYDHLSRMRGERKGTISTPRPREPPVCRSVLCRAVGSHLFYSLNLSARPCDSIYDVVCRHWVHASPAGYRRVVLGADRLFLNNIHADVERVLVSHRQSRSGRTSLDKLQRLYLLCTNAEERDRWGLATFYGLMRRYHLNGWPLRPYDGDLVQDLALFVHDTGSDVFFRLTSTPDGAEADVLTVECPSLGLPARSFTENTSDVQVYRTYILDMLQKASGRTDIERLATVTLEFEARLAHLVVAHCHGGEPYTERSINSGTVPYNVDLRTFIATAVKHYQQLQQSKIRLQSPNYFGNVTRLMQEHVASSTYFGWRVAAKLLPWTTTNIARLYHDFQADLGVELSTTGKKCLRAANDVMPLAMGRLLISEYSSKAASFEAYLLMFHLVHSLDREVYTDLWFDNETHGLYTNLRATMNTMFGYPPGLISDAMLDSYYDGVRVSQSYLDMYMSAATVTFQNSFDSNSALAFYGRERYIFLGDVLQWTDRRSPRPFYDVRRNAFILPSGVLHPPYYDDDAVPALNFGGLGFLVAYDLLRGLLSNHTDTFWGRLVAKTTVAERYSCLESRIAAESPGVQPQGLATIALAVRLAFLAYQQREDIIDDEALSGLVNLTPEQLFFVSVARTLCSVARDENYVKVVLQKVDGGALAQVDAALMWLPEFTDAFNCTRAKQRYEASLLRKERC